MKLITDFISTYGVEIMMAIITFIATYLGAYLKKVITKWLDNKTKKDVVNTCVRAVEQLYKDLHGQEKLDKCIESVSAMLSENGITITEIEIRMLIEAAVNEFNNSFNDSSNNDKDGE